MSPSTIVHGDRIKESFLLQRLPHESRLYVWPFIIAYAFWLFAVGWYTIGHVFNELWLIPLAILMLVHFLTAMSVHWSVKAEVFITCKRIDRLQDDCLVAIIPKEHGGKAQILPVIQNPDDGIACFSFQQQKFTWNVEKGLFCKPSYPDQLAFSTYRQAKGLSSTEASQARQSYGSNK